MKINPLSVTARIIRLLIVGAAFGPTGIFTTRLPAQMDDFNDGNDAGWTRYKPLDGAFGTSLSTFQFPGGGYRLTCVPPPSSAAGPARAGTLRQDKSYLNFCQAVDVTNWNDALTQSFGLLARVTNPGLGQTNGYGFTYQTHDHDLQITRITGELDPASSDNPKITLVTGKSYRFVFIGEGTNFEGRVYELPDITLPIQTVTWTDTVYASGTCGVFIFDPSSAGNSGCDATFDNYAASDLTPPPLAIHRTGADTYELTWPALPCFTLESSPDLTTGSWTSEAFNVQYDPTRNQLYHQNDFISAKKFFHLNRTTIPVAGAPPPD